MGEQMLKGACVQEKVLGRELKLTTGLLSMLQEYFQYLGSVWLIESVGREETTSKMES